MYFYFIFLFYGTVGSARVRFNGVRITMVTAEGNSSAQAGLTVGSR